MILKFYLITWFQTPDYQWTKIKDKCNITLYVIMNTSTLIYSKDQVVFLGCFLVVFCKVRDTDLPRLNQGQVWKQWGRRWGKEKNRKNFLPCPHSGIPHCFLMWPQFSLSCISCFTNAKEKKPQKTSLLYSVVSSELLKTLKIKYCGS